MFVSWICGPEPRGSRVCLLYDGVMSVVLLSCGAFWFLYGEVCSAGILSCDLVLVAKCVVMLSCTAVYSAFYLLLVDVMIIYCIKYRIFFINAYFIHLFVLFVSTIDIFMCAVHMSSLL